MRLTASQSLVGAVQGTVMLVSSTDPGLHLLTRRDVDEQALPTAIAAHTLCAQRVLRWAETYLCQVHSALGREGPVCPYAEHSLNRDIFWLAIYGQPNPTRDDVCGVLKKYRDWFLELAPRAHPDAEFKTILVLFPSLPRVRVPDAIEAVQARLKPEFVASGLMIGQFHADCDQPGVWNKEFRPLRSPVPLLAIRSMVRFDAPFLINDRASLAAYLRRFGDDVPPRHQASVLHAACAFGLDYPDMSAGSSSQPSEHRVM